LYRIISYRINPRSYSYCLPYICLFCDAICPATKCFFLNVTSISGLCRFLGFSHTIGVVDQYRNTLLPALITALGGHCRRRGGDVRQIRKLSLPCCMLHLVITVSLMLMPMSEQFVGCCVTAWRPCSVRRSPIHLSTSRQSSIPSKYRTSALTGTSTSTTMTRRSHHPTRTAASTRSTFIHSTPPSVDHSSTSSSLTSGRASRSSTTPTKVCHTPSY